MALVNVVNMTVLDNPTCFLNPFQFEITFECLQELDDDLEWKVLYVGSAHDSKYDQILDEILVGPIPVGMNKFVLQADAPNIIQLLQQPNITSDDILGVTVVLVTCSYKEREFIRIGYYVNNEYHIDDTDHNNNDMVDITTTTTTTPTTTPTTTTTTPTNAASTIVSPTSKTTTTTALDPSTTSTTPPTPPLRPKISIHDIQFDQVQRQILADKPRVTKFPIPWNLTTIATTTTGHSSNNSNSTTFGGGMPLPPPIPQHQEPNKQQSQHSSLSSTPSTMGTNTEDEMMMMDTEESS